MNRQERRTQDAKKRRDGGNTVRHEAQGRVVRHDGSLWMLSEHFIVRLGEGFNPPPEGISATPSNLAEILAGCPGEEGRFTAVLDESRVFADGGKVYQIGPVCAQQKVMWFVTGIHKDVEWRATAAAEPVFALKDNRIVGVLMGIDPQALRYTQ